jgi:hypothetical protein
MIKSVAELKDLLKREETLFTKLNRTIAVMAHKESKIVLKEMAKIKSGMIETYKMVIKASEKCPAVIKKTKKKIKKKLKKLRR